MTFERGRHCWRCSYWSLFLRRGRQTVHLGCFSIHNHLFLRGYELILWVTQGPSLTSGRKSALPQIFHAPRFEAIEASVWEMSVIQSFMVSLGHLTRQWIAVSRYRRWRFLDGVCISPIPDLCSFQTLKILECSYDKFNCKLSNFSLRNSSLTQKFCHSHTWHHYHSSTISVKFSI